MEAGALDWRHYLIIALGAMTLIVEARRQYSAPVRAEPYSQFPIIKDVTLRHLCTDSEYRRGFLVYCLLYLLLYAAGFLSVELYGVAVDSNKLFAGAGGNIDLSQLEGVLGEGFDYATPFYLSAGIITLLSTELGQPVERMVRALSHRFSGIPLGVYRVLETLCRIDYAHLIEGRAQPLPLTDLYDRAAHAHARPQAEIDKHRKLFRSIDVIAPAVLEDLRNRIFSLRLLDDFQEMLAAPAREHKALRKELELLAPVGAQTTPPTLSKEAAEERFDQLVQSAGALRNTIFAVFTLIFIQNDRQLIGARSDDPITLISRRLARDSAYFANSVWTAAIASAIAILIVDLAIYLAYYARYLDGAYANSPTRADLFGLKVEMDFLKFAVSDAIWAAAQFTSSFVVAVLSVVSIADVISRSDKWRRWSLFSIPTPNLLLSGLAPSLLYAAVFVLGLTLETAFDAGALSVSLVAREIARNYPFYLALIPIGLVSAIYLLIIHDIHRFSPAWKTIGVALLAAGPILFFAFMAEWLQVFGAGMEVSPILLRNIAMLAINAMIPIVLFAILMELSERDPNAHDVSFMARIEEPEDAPQLQTGAP